MLSDAEIRERALQECTAQQRVLCGAGLFAGLNAARLPCAVETDAEAPVDLAFVDVTALAPSGAADCNPHVEAATTRIGIATGDLQALRQLFANAPTHPLPLHRLISAAAVIDFDERGAIIREVAHGLTARDVQQTLGITLWAASDLKELEVAAPT